MRNNLINIRANADDELDVTSSLSGIRYSASEVGRFVRLALLTVALGSVSILAGDWSLQQEYGFTIDALAVGSVVFGALLKVIGIYWLAAPIYRELRWHRRPPAETLVADGVDVAAIRKEIEEKLVKEYELAYRRGQFQKFSHSGHVLTDAIVAHVLALHIQCLKQPERKFSQADLERQDVYGYALLPLDTAQRTRLWSAMSRADVIDDVSGCWNTTNEKDAIIRVLKAFGT